VGISSLAYDPRLTAKTNSKPVPADWVKSTMNRWFPEHPDSARDRLPFLPRHSFVHAVKDPGGVSSTLSRIALVLFKS
jgi:hypothetical protein